MTNYKTPTKAQIKVLANINRLGYRTAREGNSADILLASGLVVYNMNPRGEEKPWSLTEAGKRVLYQALVMGLV